MKKIVLSLLAAASLFFMGCGASKLEMQEQSSMCDVMVEVRQVLNDTISLYAGNTFYLNAKQVVADEMYPLYVSTRDPAEIEKPAATNVINSDEEFLNYLRRAAPQMTQIGLLIGVTAANEIGFDEGETVAKLTKIFQKMGGGSLILFHDNAEGELTDMKKLF